MRFMEFLIFSSALTLVTCQANDTTTILETAATTPLNTSAITVLVLSTFDPNNKPMTVNFDGVVNDDLHFKYGNGVSAHEGCGLTFKGQFWYFGGYGKSFKRQANKIVGCEMVRQFDLPFDFESGSCNTFNVKHLPEEKVLLCFNGNSPDTCHIYDGKNFTKIASSTCHHDGTFGLANYRGMALTTGSASNSNCYVKSELYDFKTNQWSNAPDYPFTSQIAFYSVASTNEASFVIGGCDGTSCSSPSDVIAQFKNNVWSLYGNLKNRRGLHGSVTYRDQTMVIGGFSLDNRNLETEIWDLKNGTHKTIDPSLSVKYRVGLGLCIVPADFCNED